MWQFTPRQLRRILAAGLTCVGLLSIGLVCRRIGESSEHSESAAMESITSERILRFRMSSEDSRYLARLADRRVVLRSVADDRQIAAYSGNGLSLSAVAIAPNRKCFLSVDRSGNVGLTQVRNNGFETRQVCNLATPTVSCSISRDESLGAFACADGHVDVRNLATGQCRFRLRCANRKASRVYFSPMHDHLLTVFDDGGMTLWNARTGNSVREFACGGARILHVGFASDGRRFVTAGMNGHVGIWGFRSSTPLRTLVSGNQDITSIAVANDGNRIAVGDLTGTISIWQMSTGASLGRIDVDKSAIFDLQFAHDDTAIFNTCSQPGLSRIELEAFAAAARR